MPRPNYACDAPPTEIIIGGRAYPADWDYRTWIRAVRLLEQLSPGGDPVQIVRSLTLLARLQRLVFGCVIDAPPEEILRAISQFAAGYPETAPAGGGDGPRTLCFERDLNLILPAMRSQFGVDLSHHRREPFHWWEFLILFRALSGDHAVLRLMEIRAYRGTDSRMLKLRSRYALREAPTEAERAEAEQFSSLFYGS